MKNGPKSVSLSSELYEKLEKKSSETGFKTVDEFVAFVLEQVLEEEAPKETMTKSDEAEVKKRLKSLGYLD